MKTKINDNRIAFQNLIYYATKAPSTHNTQPWKFRVDEEGILILPDLSHALSKIDASHRELYISLGCALQNLLIAAREFNFKPSFEFITTYTNTINIKIRLEREGRDTSATLFQFIDERQTNRTIYNGTKIHPIIIDKLVNIKKEEGTHIYSFEKESESFKKLTDLIIEANSILMNDDEYKEEVVDWIRFNMKDALETKDGLNYETVGTIPVPKVLGKTIAKYIMNEKRQNKYDLKKIDSSSHMVLFTADENNEKAWIKLGMTLQRFLLHTTKKGIAVAFINPPCEVHEMAEKMKNTLPIGNQYPNILVRIGYAESAPYSKRKDIKNVIIP
ncbi:nitroreductase [Spongiivirga sp. MCCC 1A20706]|uniref:Acg family FMN-binding oxidoreductase n=1 Tax=Spongiivirga sp. MCCC 1A20706 TaxID=3160963 RepID=UPI00397774ED